MVTARTDLKQRLFSDMKNSSALLALLGIVSSDNFRIYSGWPTQQPKLSSTEAAEGWIAFFELSAVIPWQTLYEDHVFQVNIWATRQAINDACMDLLDGLWRRAPVDQDGFQITADWQVVAASRIMSQETYEQEVKLHRKICNYQFRTMKIPWRRGA